MEKKKEAEWVEAQEIVISKDLVAATKHQLKFLAAVDRNRNLYNGPALERAICRYTPLQYINILIAIYFLVCLIFHL